jgi:hypothetical protein
MRRGRLVARLSLSLLLPGLVWAQGAPAIDTSGWKPLREPALGFALKHPAAWRVGRSTGTLESVVLSEPAPDGAPRVTMQVLVQRNINPRGLSIEAWYADQLRRFKVAAPPPTVTTVIGGRPAIRRDLTRPDGRRHDFYTAVNGSDIFQVSIAQPAAARPDPTLEAVVATITFLE